VIVDQDILGQERTSFDESGKVRLGQVNSR